MTDAIKYRLTEECREIDGVTLRRIKLMRRIGAMPAGYVGGWVESENNLAQDGDAWIEDNSIVMGGARVEGDARVRYGSMVSGKAVVRGKATVSNSTVVDGGVVEDFAALVEAEIKDNGRVSGLAKCYGGTVSENAHQMGGLLNARTTMAGHSRVCFEGVLEPDASITGHVVVAGRGRVGRGVRLDGWVEVVQGGSVAEADAVPEHASVRALGENRSWNRDVGYLDRHRPLNRRGLTVIHETDVTEADSPKYALTSEARWFHGVVVFRIKALREGFWGPAGTLGGFVEDERNLSHLGDCWVWNDAIVFENARVQDDAQARHDAVLCGNALLKDAACACGEALLKHDAVAEGNALVRSATLTKCARVMDQSELFCAFPGDVEAADFAIVHEEGKMLGHARVGDGGRVAGRGVVKDWAKVGDTAVVQGRSVLAGNAKLLDCAVLDGASHVSGPVCIVLSRHHINLVVSDADDGPDEMIWQGPVVEASVHYGKLLKTARALDQEARDHARSGGHRDAHSCQVEKETFVLPKLELAAQRLAEVRFGGNVEAVYNVFGRYVEA